MIIFVDIYFVINFIGIWVSPTPLPVDDAMNIAIDAAVDIAVDIAVKF